MRPVYAEIELVSGEDMIDLLRGRLDKDKTKKIKVTARIDTGVTHLFINEYIRDYFQLRVIDHRPFKMPNGEVIYSDMVGSLEIRFQNRNTFCSAVVMPGNAQPVLGCTYMQAMDVLIDPVRQELVVNPKHPDYAVHRL